MRYFLVNHKTRSATLLFSKVALHDWIFSHSYALSSRAVGNFSLYRVIVRKGLLGHNLYMQGPCICSLKDYIIRQNLDLIEL